MSKLTDTMDQHAEYQSAEIDRTLKSVATGVEVFEATFDKLNYATNTTQKDKLENDLKTQIKKLQRMRDQIKAWLGNGDIKDKTALLENRRLIETQMERFKALEKETKMKAFSKEGLIAQSKLDPAEKAKRDMIDWIGSTTDELSRQIEQTEAEVEALQVGKKKKQAGERLDELEELNERREWHIGRLEVVQRMLENGQLTVGDVEDIQEDVKYFVEANMVCHIFISPSSRRPLYHRKKTLTLTTVSTTNSIFKMRKTSTTISTNIRPQPMSLNPNPSPSSPHRHQKPLPRKKKTRKPPLTGCLNLNLEKRRRKSLPVLWW